jgi:DNA-binding transcriptional MocR family regulator
MQISGRTATDIAASLERGLYAGAQAPGDALPTVRELAADLGVSPATVSSAYKLLRTRGLVVGLGRRGTRVSPRILVPFSVAHPAVPVGTIDLATGNPDPALLAPLGPAMLLIKHELRLYGGQSDHPGLTAFASAEFEADGVSGRAVAVLSGAMDAIERVLREHLRPGDRVALEDPSFPSIADLTTTSGYTPVPFAMDDDGPLPDALAAALGHGCGALIVTPRAQNPTGAAISAERADALRRVLRDFPGIVLIENDCAGPVAGAAMHTLTTATHQRWAVVRSTSKFLGPDLRVAVMAGDAVTVARVRGRQALGSRWVSYILQQLALTLWSDPSSGRRLARAGEIYAHRRNAVLAALRSRNIEAVGRSGLNVWVPVRNEASVVRSMADRGWAVAAGERFRLQAAPGIRVTVSAQQPRDADRLAGDLADSLQPAQVGFA